MRKQAGIRGSLSWKMCCIFLMLSGPGAYSVLGQDKPVQGIIFDKDTKERIARVSIINMTSGLSFYNNLKGEFSVSASTGDKLVFIKEYYYNDTVLVKNNSNLIIYLSRNSIMLHEVTIRDSLHTPMQRLLATRREYSKAYGSNAFSNPFSTVPGGGAGFNLDALYNSFSKSGRDAAHLQVLIQQDYQQNVIDYRFNRSFVGNITKLKGTDLNEFMTRYRPSYYTVTSDTEYEFISYIRTSLRRFLRNRRANPLPSLKSAQSGT